MTRHAPTLLILVVLLSIGAATDQYGAAAWRWVKFMMTREAYPEDFATGSSTLGFQEAIDWICATGQTGHGAKLRIGGKVYDFGASASLTVPADCHGFTMEGTSGDTYNGVVGTGSELKTSLNGDFLTITAALKNVRLAGFQITASPGASTRVIVAGNLSSRLNIENIRISKTGAASANGIGLYLDDPVKCLIENSEFELLGAGIVHSGTLGAGGCVYSHNRIETQGNTTGVGLLIGEANYACSNVLLDGNILEGNNIGLKIDTTTAVATSCKVTAMSNHFENTIGSNYEDVRATGANSYVSIGNYYAGGGSGAEDIFHRTTDTDSASTDIFMGDQLYGTITMDAGSCMILGAADWYSGGSLSACARQSVDSVGFYIDVNSDGDFDQGTDSRLGRSFTSSSAPVDGTTACETDDTITDTTNFKFYKCVNGSTDKWYGVALVDTP